MFQYNTQLRVRYAETDQMAYVYYGNYATYFEVGRVEALRSLGTSYKELEAAGVMMPVTEQSCKHIAPARYDDLLTVETIILSLPSSRIHFRFNIYNEAATLLAEGEVTLAFVDMKTLKPIRCPDILLNQLKHFF
jgi:acyl-CoA thioester hydrolase